MKKYQPMNTITEQEYFEMPKKEFEALQPELDSVLMALAESLKRQDVFTAIHLVLLLPRFMVIDQLAGIQEKIKDALANVQDKVDRDENWEDIHEWGSMPPPWL